jgi:hypothetical protein
VELGARGITHAYLGEHLIRYTHEQVVPSIRAAAKALRLERGPPARALS